MQHIGESPAPATANQGSLYPTLLYTWDVGGHVDGRGWPEAFDRAGSDEELVGCPWVQMHEDMMCAIPQVGHSLGRASHWDRRIKWSYAAIADLWQEIY